MQCAIRVRRDNGNHKKNDLPNRIPGKPPETPTRAAQSRSLALIIKKYALVWHECPKSVPKVSQKCLKVYQKGVKSVRKRHKSVTKASQKRHKSVSRASQKRHKSFSERFECASNVFQSVSRVLCYVHSICCIPYGVLEHLFFDTPLQRNACFSLLGTVVQLCRCIMAGLPSWVNEHPVSTQ